MSTAATNLQKLPEPPADGAAEACDLETTRIPHVSIHAFRETDAFGTAWRRAAQDRRLVSATTMLHDGGFPAAIAMYKSEKTPDLIIVETKADEATLRFQTDSLADVCDPDTRVVVVGHRNDIHLYQRLLEMGVSDYLVAPVTVSAVIQAIANVYREPGKEKIGRVTAVIGAKGGVGASAVAQNVALELSGLQAADVLLVDLDLGFGTASLNLDVEANQGLAELVDQAERIDTAMLDRVLIRRGQHLNLLATAASLGEERELDDLAIERILEVAQAHIPHVVLDMPHLWNGWVKRALILADRVVLVSTPDLCSLRNAAAMIAELKTMRPNDPAPHLVLNQTGVPRRQEITAKDVRSILKIEPAACIPFDPKTFSLATARGKLVCEVGQRKPVANAYRALAGLLGPAPDRLTRAARSPGLSKWWRP